MNDRRSTDDASHAHKRSGDPHDFARLHQRLDDSDRIMAELMLSRTEMMGAISALVAAQTGTTESMLTLSAAVSDLTIETKGAREIESDVSGMLRLMGKFNGVLGILWRPTLFIGVVCCSIYIYLFGRPPP